MHCTIEPAHIPERGIRRLGKKRWDNDLFQSIEQGGIAALLNLSTPERRVSMISLGRHGRWGNTLLQYIFLRAFASEYSLRHEIPKWVGRYLFGLADHPVSFGPENIVIDNASQISDPDNHFWWPYNPFLQRASYLAKHLNLRPYRLRLSRRQNQNSTHFPFSKADLEGLFMIHTGNYKKMRNDLRSLIKPVPELQSSLEPAIEGMRGRGKTIVGIHLRRGDFTASVIRQDFELVTPASIYINWLKSIWPSLHAPVLFVASDDIDSVISDFAEFNPITSRDLGAEMPAYMKRLDLSPHQIVQSVDFFPDWYLLTQCDLLVIANSTFSFSAAMFSERGHMFFRPTFSDRKLVPFDPWNSEPVLFAPYRHRILHGLSQCHKYQTIDHKKTSWFNRVIMIAKSYVGLLMVRAYCCARLQGWTRLCKAMLTPKFYLASGVRYDYKPY